MQPRAVAGAVPDERVLPFAHEFDLVVGRSRPVKPAESQGRATSLDDDVLEVTDRFHHRLRRRPLLEVQRVFFGLHPAAFADSVPTGVALRNEVGDTDRVGGGQQVVRPLGAQPVGDGEPPIHVLDIGLLAADRGHLVDNRVGQGLGHRLTDGHFVQPVHHDGVGAQLLQQAQLGRVRRRSRHLIAMGHELRHQSPPHDPGRSCHEHSHDNHLRILQNDSQPNRRDNPAVQGTLAVVLAEPGVSWINLPNQRYQSPEQRSRRPPMV